MWGVGEEKAEDRGHEPRGRGCVREVGEAKEPGAGGQLWGVGVTELTTGAWKLLAAIRELGCCMVEVGARARG